MGRHPEGAAAIPLVKLPVRFSRKRLSRQNSRVNSRISICFAHPGTSGLKGNNGPSSSYEEFSRARTCSVQSAPSLSYRNTLCSGSFAPPASRENLCYDMDLSDVPPGLLQRLFVSAVLFTPVDLPASNLLSPHTPPTSTPGIPAAALIQFLHRRCWLRPSEQVHHFQFTT